MRDGRNDLIAPQIAAKALVLAYEHTSPELAVTADAEKLRQILLNLLSNAVRYTPSGGHIAMAAAAQPNGTVLITVEDDGPGIPLESQAMIFEPFARCVLHVDAAGFMPPRSSTLMPTACIVQA